MRLKITLFLLITAYFLTSGSLRAADITLNAGDFLISNSKPGKYEKLLNNSKVINFNLRGIKPILNKSSNLTIRDFPIDNKTAATISLKRMHSVVDENTRFITATKMGDVEVPGPEVESYTGTISGEADSKVYLIISDSMMFCSIKKGDRTYLISPEKNRTSLNEHLLYNEKDLSAGIPFKFTCGIDDIAAIKAMGSKVFDPPLVQSTNLLETELAVETDSRFFNTCGGTLAKAQAYTVAMYALVSSLYEAQLNICFRLTWVKTWTDNPTDPYNSNGLWTTLKDASVPYWDQHYQNVERDIAQVVTTDPTGAGQGGWGALNSLCDKGNSGSMSFVSIQGYNLLPTHAFSYDVYTIAHEIGHNFGSVHTHSCFWNPPIDTCWINEDNTDCVPPGQQRIPNPGSIMSYCPVVNNDVYGRYECRLIFLDRPGQVIRSNAEKASCLTEPAAPMVSLLYPDGEETFAPGDKINIKWVYSKVNSIKIEYTDDMGSSWKEIKNSVSAGNKQYEWTIPNICGRARVRVTDVSNPLVSDSSIKEFSIGNASGDNLIAYYPFDNNSQDMICHFYDASPQNAVITSDRFNTPNSAYKLNGSANLLVKDFNRNSDEFSVSLWFTTDVSKEEFSTLACQDYSKGGAFQFMIQYGFVGAAAWFDKAGTPPVVAWSSSEVQLDKWNHAVAVYSKNDIKVYVNGSLVASASISAPIKKVLNNMYFGSRSDLEHLKGNLDDIKIFSKALTQSEVQNLFKEVKVKPEVSVLSIPEDKSTGLDSSVTFVWEPAEYARKYHLQIAKSQDFASASIVIDNSELTSTYYDIDHLLGNQTYYWRVETLNNIGSGGWSEVFSFTTKEYARPAVTVLSLPEDKASDIDTAVTLMWNAAANAESYHLQLSESADFAAASVIIDNTDLTNTSLNVKELKRTRTYYWRVEAVNENGGGGWSDIFSFTTGKTVSVKDYDNSLNSEIHPNPATNTAVICLDNIPPAITLSIINELGDIISVNYEFRGDCIEMNTSFLAAGCYFYKLQAGNRTDIKKFCIIR